MGQSRESTIFLAVLICCLASLGVAKSETTKEKTIAGSYPLVVDDGNDSYLVLNDDEILQNPKLLKHLSSASKEEVEEMVDGNPVVQTALLNKIRDAVDKKKILKAKGNSKLSPSVNKGKYQSYYEDVVAISDGDLADTNEEEEDDDQVDEELEDEVSLAKWKDKFKLKPSKIFKIGNKFKEKLIGMKRKKAAKKEAKHSSWPHFHYKFSHN